MSKIYSPSRLTLTAPGKNPIYIGFGEYEIKDVFLASALAQKCTVVDATPTVVDVTPEVTEPVVEPEPIDDREAEIQKAVKAIMDGGDKALINAHNKPRVDAVNELIGGETTAQEIGDAVAALKA